MTNNFKKGDIIHSEKFDEYAIFLGNSPYYVGWIEVYLLSTCERKQVHDCIWEIL